MTIKSNSIEPPFSSFVTVTLLAHLVFAVPVAAGILLFGFIDLLGLGFIIVPFTLLSIPGSAFIAYLIAKGSNWVNATAGLTAACTLPGRMYGLLFGGLVGYRLFSTTGGIILALIFFLLGYAAAIPLGKFLLKRVIPGITAQSGQNP